MNASPKVSMALGFILAFPLFALPALGASAPEVDQMQADHRVADIAKAKALVRPATRALDARTDGLSRNDEDCNMGCIDH